MTFSPRAIALALAGVALAFLAANLWAQSPQPSRAMARSTSPTSSPSSPAPSSHVADGGTLRPVAGGKDLVSYAVAVNELHGLPPQAAPGTLLDVWVAWEPPVTKQPRIAPLLSGVILEEIAPPMLPDGPYAALLLVPRNEVSDLLYGDRYGSLSVIIPQAMRAAE